MDDLRKMISAKWIHMPSLPSLFMKPMKAEWSHKQSWLHTFQSMISVVLFIYEGSEAILELIAYAQACIKDARAHTRNNIKAVMASIIQKVRIA